MSTYNVLTLDGGGSWAILQAQALGGLYGYDTPGQTILANFTLAVANSGGSIVLAGLAVNYTPRQLFDFLNNQSLRQTIFVKNHNLYTAMGLERYDTPAKLQGLRGILSKAPLGTNTDLPLNQIKLPCKLLISTFNYDRLRAEFFRSDVSSRAASASGSPQPTLAEAVHASTNAPIKYFDAPAQFAPANPPSPFAGCRYWDGAMGGFNNPVMAAITEMLAYGYAPTDLRVLSIGTASVFLPMPNPMLAPDASGQNPLCVPIVSSSLLHDVKDVLPTIIVDDPPDQASFVAHLLVSGAAALSQDPKHPVTNGNLVRLNPWIQPISTPTGWAVPPLIKYAIPPSTVPANYANDTAAFSALVNLDMDAIEQSQVDLITMLGSSWIAGDTPNQSIRATSDLQPLIGHGRFPAAVAQARAIGLV
jgi:uncharacterized protein